MKFHKYEDFLASGAQPTPEQFGELAEQGWEVVVNLSPTSTRNALRDEAAIVDGLGLDYVHFPVDCSALRPSHYLVFKGILAGFEGRRVFVHCGGNIKSSTLIHMYRVLERGVPADESLAELRSIQNPEAKWFAYFESMGMPKKDNAA
jgi:protein tyrosine phosphatase (PTP) superfamily phosphohydrolase (DUF442 family)